MRFFLQNNISAKHVISTDKKSPKFEAFVLILYNTSNISHSVEFFSCFLVKKILFSCKISQLCFDYSFIRKTLVNGRNNIFETISRVGKLSDSLCSSSETQNNFIYEQYLSGIWYSNKLIDVYIIVSNISARFSTELVISR